MKHLLPILTLCAICLTSLLLAGCGGGMDSSSIVPPTPGTASIQLFSKYDQNGQDTITLQWNGFAHFAYMKAGEPIAVIAVATVKDTTTKLVLSGPNNFTDTQACPKASYNIPGIGAYTVKVIKDGQILASANLTIKDISQQPALFTSVESFKNTQSPHGTLGTKLVCTVVNNNPTTMNDGFGIEQRPDGIVDFQSSEIMGGHFGLIDAGQYYLPRHTTVWRSSTNQTAGIDDDIVASNYNLQTALAPGETVKISTWWTSQVSTNPNITVEASTQNLLNNKVRVEFKIKNISGTTAVDRINFTTYNPGPRDSFIAGQALTFDDYSLVSNGVDLGQYTVPEPGSAYTIKNGLLEQISDNAIDDVLFVGTIGPGETVTVGLDYQR